MGTHPCFTRVKVVLSARFYFAIAIAAINRFATARFEGDFGLFAALGTHSRIHLAAGSVATTAAAAGTLCLPCLTAGGTALRLIGVAFGLIELLLFCGEGKGSPTIGTTNGLFLKTHE
jgi:hypothetical protein